MSNEEKTPVRSIILWSIGLSILIISLTAVTFILMFPGNQDFTIDEFSLTGNDCLTDMATYIEIKNRDDDRGWIHYGNSTDIMNHLNIYCNPEL